jgi:predicted LPLAT superfamily acyltransferase
LTGAPVIPIFTAKKGLRTYTIKAAQPIFVAGDAQTDRNAAIAQALGTFVKLLEEAVKENPYEWFNFYDFWQEG